jgi:hypothetical protein
VPNPANTATRNISTVSINIANILKTVKIGDYNSEGSGILVRTGLLPNDWFVIESGTSHDMINTLRLLSNVSNTHNRFVTVGNGQKLDCNQVGTLKLGSVSFEGVLVVIGLDKNLISVGKTLNGQWEFSNKAATLCNNDKALMTAQVVNELYSIKASDLQATAMLANADSEAVNLLLDWHYRLGHLSIRSVMDLSRDGRIDGLS